MKIPQPRREYEIATPGRSRSGLALLVLAVVTAITAVTLLIDAQDDYWRLGGAAGLGILTWFLARMGKRRRIPVLRGIDALAKLAARTKIPVVVYLRRFDDDQGVEHPPATESDEHDSDEAELARAFGRYCLFVAVGRPGEPLPPWGAYRLYLENDNWEAEVRRLVSIASVIIVKWEDSGPLRTEIRLLKEAAKLKRTMFLFPPLDSPAMLCRYLPDEESLRFETPEAPNDRRYAAFLTLTETGGKVHYRDRKLGYGESAKQVVVESFDMVDLTEGQLNIMRGFYGGIENLASRAMIIAFFTLVGALLALMLLVPSMGLFAWLSNEGIRFFLTESLLDYSDLILTGLGLLVLVSIGFLILLFVFVQRTMP